MRAAILHAYVPIITEAGPWLKPGEPSNFLPLASVTYPRDWHKIQARKIHGPSPDGTAILSGDRARNTWAREKNEGNTQRKVRPRIYHTLATSRVPWCSGHSWLCEPIKFSFWTKLVYTEFLSQKATTKYSQSREIQCRYHFWNRLKEILNNMRKCMKINFKVKIRRPTILEDWGGLCYSLQKLGSNSACLVPVLAVLIR